MNMPNTMNPEDNPPETVEECFTRTFTNLMAQAMEQKGELEVLKEVAKCTKCGDRGNSEKYHRMADCDACNGTGNRYVQLEREVESWKKSCEKLRDQAKERTERLCREEASVANLLNERATLKDEVKLLRMRPGAPKRRERKTRSKK